MPLLLLVSTMVNGIGTMILRADIDWCVM